VSQQSKGLSSTRIFSFCLYIFHDRKLFVFVFFFCSRQKYLFNAIENRRGAYRTCATNCVCVNRERATTLQLTCIIAFMICTRFESTVECGKRGRRCQRRRGETKTVRRVRSIDLSSLRKEFYKASRLLSKKKKQ